MSTEPVRDTTLLSIGKQCSSPSCLLVDFLPFKCQHCEQPFCADHFQVSGVNSNTTPGHKCPKYDEQKHNRIAPNCPLCNSPVAVRPNQDPNVRMEDHFANECSVMTGKSTKAKSLPVCGRAKCGKVLFAPIRCDKCREQFCPQHRFPNDHNCSTSSASKPTTSPKKPLTSINITTKDLNTTATATLGAIKKTLANTTRSNTTTTTTTTTSSTSASTSTSKSTTTTTTTTTSTVPPAIVNPFSKTDRLPISNKSSSSTTNDNNTTNEPEPKPKPLPVSVSAKSKSTSKPEPVIDPMSFVPRPIFASA